ncbi:MAG: glycine betaine ABC transporter substrate-binding protein [Gammaproteobacteria bacterium]
MFTLTKLIKRLFSCLFIGSLLYLPISSFAEAKVIRIGAKDFTEQFILARIAKSLLEDAGFSVKLTEGIATLIARQSLESNQLDLFFEYTGTGYVLIYKQHDSAIIRNPQKIYQWIKTNDLKKDLIWLKPLPFNNTYAIIMRRELAKKLHIKSISDLAHYNNTYSKPLSFGVSAEVWARDDGFQALMNFYNFQLPFNAVRKMDAGLVYLALKQSYIDSGIGYTTDGRIAAFDFIVLQDDKHFFPSYNPAPVVRKVILEQYPELPKILAPMQCLHEQDIRTLNAKVAIEHRSVTSVVKQWLQTTCVRNKRY